ncbi:MAG: molybdate ABC transporter substrate-binding protein [Phycisphaerales bacterium]|nr:molybdate ABC transporter substrate-binding protein [Phycisphaerales bacterium]MCI0629762.1 molybdate ABC transporter substrate-binding protein [Phycisphaerales bacterium]MCI0676497.1 molybdate ABC transporter substrate-binding protein [Phycisphaerales bacterium]
MRTFVSFVLGLFVVLMTACEPPQPAAPTQVTVFAAASTTDVMREAGRRFETKTGTKVVFSFDSSSNLAKQIKIGSPANVFISADQKWMDDVAAADAIRPETRQDLLANDLVMIAPAGKQFDVQPAKDFDFAARLPQVKRIAVGDPSHVPAGRYAQQALESLGWWKTLQPFLMPAQDVRAALRLVEIGEADAGIVYSTDARQSEKVVVVARFHSELHEPIHYPVALCKDSPAAAQFVAFLSTAEMTEVFQTAGFRVLQSPKGR